ncbi:hypothetical protein CR513_55389, partial [Mucuna pruriens]
MSRSRLAVTYDSLCFSNHGSSPNELYNYKKGAASNCICLRQISFIFARFQKARCKAETNSVVLLLQEFDLEIIDKKGVENSVVDHLSRIEREINPMSI